MATLSHHHEASKIKDGIEWILEDHKHIIALFDRYNETQSEAAKLAIVNQLVKDVSGHASAEERYAYPLITSHLRHTRPDAETLYDRNVMDDQINKDMLHWLRSHTPKNALEWQIFDRTMKKFELIEREHLQQEEDTWMPALKLVMNKQELEKLWDDLDWAKRHAPTHPHPNAPDKPILANIMHPIAAVADKVMDSMSHK